MRFITFVTNDHKHKLGMTDDQGNVIDLSFFQNSHPFFSDMLSFIRAGDKALEVLNDICATMPEVAVIDKKKVTLLAPIPRPSRNIYCIGLNYAEHNAEFSREKDEGNIPEAPIVFSKVPTAVIGPEAFIEAHEEVTQELDYEAELAIVIGTRGRDIPREEALNYVFGYTIINDITARDLQRRHQQWLLGKSLDTFCPMGPSLVHRSVIEKPDQLKITCKVNGELRQSSNTKHMIFDIPTIISTISKGHTLEPGDVIATGTCAGVGMGFNPPKYLKKGDVIEIEIELLGRLRNTVR